MPTPTLTAAELTIRPLDPSGDAAALHAVFGDREQLRFMLREPFPDVAGTRAQLERWATDETSPQWALVTESGEVVGRVTLMPKRAGVCEVGVQVVPGCQRRGYARRAIDAVTRYAFESLGAFRVFADIDPGNVACVRAFERAGFEREGVLRANWVVDGVPYDSVILARLRP